MQIRRILCLPLLLSLASIYLFGASAVSYDIVYVRAPRAGDSTYIRLPDVFWPTAMPPGSDLMLLHPNGSEETLFAAGKGAVLDPVVSFDAQWVYFAYIPDNTTATGINYQRGLSVTGSDIYKINLASRQLVRLSSQEWTPPTSLNWSTNLLSASSPNSIYLGYGIFNLAPCPLPNGKLMFVSSRDSYLPNKGYTQPNLRLYIMDDDGRNVEPIGHINIGSALHPVVLMDGRVMFSSFETQGARDSRNWSLWAIWPDGRRWEPLVSSMGEALAFHFQTQLSDGRVAVTWYYNLNDNGFGTILAFDPAKPAGAIPFGSPIPSDASNPQLRVGLWPQDSGSPLQPRYTQFAFSPPGFVNLTAFTHGEDNASPPATDGSYAGKTTHPAAAPNNDLLMSWTPGPANNLNRPTTIPVYDSGIYLLKNGQPLDDYHNLILIKNDPNYNELEPRPVVTYQAIYGMAQPKALPFLPNDGTLSAFLPAGTPFGLIGASSFYNRNTTPGFGNSSFKGLDSFNTSQNGESSNWFSQGSDAGVYTNDDIYAVRVVAMEAVAHRSYPNGSDPGFLDFSGRERLRILGEIPLRKSNGSGAPVLDAQGNPDTSFVARIPADTPISFQTLDKNGLVLNMAQTWHMVRPGEIRTDCGGCHAHHQTPLDFSGTAAAQPNYQVHDLTTTTPLLSKDSAGNTVVKDSGKLIVDVEYYKDIKPILQRSCVQCHTGSTPAGNLVLDDTAIVNGYENTYNRLANDPNAQYGYKPVIAAQVWRQTNASRYVRMFQSRRSLLAWKVFGKRLDGWLNSDHPTEAVPGNAATLPAAASPDSADLDYTGAIMPPPNSGVPALSEDEKMTIARWIDLGAPISQTADPSYKGYFSDELKPTLAVSSPRAGASTQPLSAIRIGMFDAYSGIKAGSLSVAANFAVNGVAAGGELAGLFSQSDGVWQLNLSVPITSLAAGHIVAKVKDNAGNLSVVDRTFSVSPGANPPPSVAVVAPANGATLSGSVTIAAQAQSAAGVASVRFQLDGAALGSAIAGPGPNYSMNWNTATVANGQHSIAATATDTNGLTATSAAISFTVSNAVTPPPGTAFLTGSPITFLRNNYSGFVGMKFTTGSKALKVSQLGRWVVAGNGQTHTVKLVNADGSDISGGAVSLNLSGATAGGYSYASLPHSILLSPGTSYFLVTEEFQNGDKWYERGSVAADSSAGIVNWSAYQANGIYYQVYDGSSSYGTPNFLFSSAPGQTPPAVSITAPANGASVTGLVTLRATAAASSGLTVASVQFQVNGQNIGAASTSAPYSTSLNTASLVNTTYTITAVAVDSSGVSAASSPISISVNNGGSGVSIPLLTSGPPSTRLRNDYAGYVGFQFTVAANPITVTHLGRWVVPGSNAQTHPLKLVDAAGRDVPGASVALSLNAVGGGQYAYAALPAAITLAANTTYFLMTQEFSGGDTWFDLGPVTANSAAAKATLATYRQSNGVYYSLSPGSAYGTPNLLFY